MKNKIFFMTNSITNKNKFAQTTKTDSIVMYSFDDQTVSFT